jgi:hypothetical protein
MTEDILALFIPIAFFLLVGIVVWGYFLFRQKSRADLQQTIRLALDKGQELSPELIDRIGEPRPDELRDLRRGLISFALAIAFAVFGHFIPDDEAGPIFLGIAAFPAMLGIAYILMWKVTSSRNRSGASGVE